MNPDKCANYGEAIEALDKAVDAVERELTAARAAAPIDLDSLARLLETVARAAGTVRQAVEELASAADTASPHWGDRAELDTLVVALVARVAESNASRWRDQLCSVATALRRG